MSTGNQKHVLEFTERVTYLRVTVKDTIIVPTSISVPKNIENFETIKISELVKSKGFDRNGRHHEPYLEKLCQMQWFMLIFELRRPI